MVKPHPASVRLQHFPARLGRLGLLAVGGLLAASALAQTVPPKADIRATRHNFSTTLSAGNQGRPTQLQSGLTAGTGAGGRTIYSSTETQVCVFCHTPHQASLTDGGGNVLKAPLWNRTVRDTAPYQGYRSTSMDATGFSDMASSAAGLPGGSSKLCLSCHDGAIAVGQVNVNAGKANNPTTIAAGTGNLGTIPDGVGTYSGKLTGNTRNLGTDLTNDHPISVTFNTTLATADGELRPVDANQQWSSGGTLILGKRSNTVKPRVPLEATASNGDGQVQCASCHDPHIAPSTTNPENNEKFLRLNRFQTTESPVEDSMSSAFNPANDIICLSCHQKTGWADSVHADKQTNSARYTTKGATDRGFPANIEVWRVACLNCHDTHAVSGTRRLLREGVTGALITGTTVRQGTAVSNFNFATAALENTCFQCHSQVAAADRVVDQQATSTVANQVPNIKSDFDSARRMPIAKSPETHNIANDTFTSGTTYKAKDFIESRARLGYNDTYTSTTIAPPNRHAECTDCHNPHRMRKTNKFWQTPTTTTVGYGQAAHSHSSPHSNVISGALRGIWGVEPQYFGTNPRLSQYVTGGQLSALVGSEFNTNPADFEIKSGDPGSGISADPPASATYLTREYQICLKCHSNFAYKDVNSFPDGHSSADRPALGCAGCTPRGSLGTGATLSDADGLKQYTNQAMEFYAPPGHDTTTSAANTGAHKRYEAAGQYNHRSWHPVMKPTGRHAGKTGAPGPFDAPWNGALSTQTMYCSDCHGNALTHTTESTAPDTGKPWGPHGSANNFILKTTFGSGGGQDQPTAWALCLRCHNQDKGGLAGNGSNVTGSGFDHPTHGGKNALRCTNCHVAVPHGWKNKALLVNLNDVGPEVMCRSSDVSITSPACTVGQPIPPGTQVTAASYTNPPYYQRAYAKILTFRQSGNWSIDSCGASTSNNGESWMRGTCENAF